MNEINIADTAQNPIQSINPYYFVTLRGLVLEMERGHLLNKPIQNREYHYFEYSVI